MILTPAVIAVIMLIGYLFVFTFDTPYYIYSKSKDKNKTLKVLKKIYTNEKASEELESIVN